MQETGRLFSCCPSVLYKNGEKRNSIKCTLGAFLHLLLRPIFRQLHPNFINVRTAYASEIWAQLTKNLLVKSSAERLREYIKKQQEEEYSGRFQHRGDETDEYMAGGRLGAD